MRGTGGKRSRFVSCPEKADQKLLPPSTAQVEFSKTLPFRRTSVHFPRTQRGEDRGKMFRADLKRGEIGQLPWRIVKPRLHGHDLFGLRYFRRGDPPIPKERQVTGKECRADE